MAKATLIFYLLMLTMQLVKPAGAQQRNEIGLLLGARVESNPGTTPPVEIGKSLAFQATYAHWFVQTGAAAVALEFPFVALPSQDVNTLQQFAPRNFASIFLTPGVRLKLVPKSHIAPWASIGGGYARFAESSTLIRGTGNPFLTGTNKGALQFGGGIDVQPPIRLWLPIGFRGEVRDFYSGQPRLNVITTKNGQHNVIVSGGLVVRF